MKSSLFLIPLIFLSVTYLIYCELNGEKKKIYFIKPLSTVLVILTALQSFSGSSVNFTYSVGVTMGLILSLGGDIALMFQDDKKLFRIGLVLFLLAHIFYAAVFTIIGTHSIVTLISILAAAFLGLVIYRLIRNNLGTMKIPVIAYIFIISIMVIQAAGVYGNSKIQTTQASMIFAGAVLFYISDVMLASNRFWKPWKYNRISLGFYYGGQYLIALSTGYFVS